MCDNDCAFCIEKSGADSFGATDVDSMVKSTLLSPTKDVLILGGEPFLQVRKLKEYVQRIRSAKRNIYITTSLPKQLDVTNPDVMEILNLIDGLNVSLQHYDPRINNMVLVARSGHDRIQQLADIVSVINRPEKVRVSINLVKGMIDTKDKMFAFVKTMLKAKVKHLKINELQNSPDLYVSYAEMMGVKMKSAYSEGCQTELPPVDGMRITLKRSCWMTEDSLLPTYTDMVKWVINGIKGIGAHTNVLYENGMVSDGWIKKV
jgi:pyruvate-formate lyase-activating enzyme